MRCEHHRGHEHGSLLDLTSKPKDGILLEALPDVEDILVLKCNESHLLQTPRTRLLYELHNRLWRRKKELERRNGWKKRSRTRERVENNVDSYLHYLYKITAFISLSFFLI